VTHFLAFDERVSYLHTLSFTIEKVSIGDSTLRFANHKELSEAGPLIGRRFTSPFLGACVVKPIVEKLLTELF
jgi:hypothetical protein